MAQLSCDDYLQFKKNIQRDRLLDDRITVALNSIIPTQSFAASTDFKKQCQGLYQEMSTAHRERDSAIQKCISVYTDKLNKLRAEQDQTDEQARQLRKAQQTLRELHSDLNEEQVIQRYSTTVFYERCRDFYKPPDMKI